MSIKYKGVLGSLKGSKIVGWVYETNKMEKPCTLNLSINGKLFEIKADKFRKDLIIHSSHPTGKCGFEFDISQYLLNDNLTIQIKIENFEIPKSESFKQELAMLFDKEQYFFMHIPKTAGTSLRHSLYKQFDQGSIFPNVDDINKFKGYPSLKIIKSLEANRFNNIRLFMGHYPYISKKIFSPDNNGIKCFTFFRDPIDRAISNLFHAKSYFENFKGMALDKVFERLGNQISNYQVRFFLDNPNKEEVNKEDLKIAISRLESLDFVGLTSDYALSVSHLKKKFGWHKVLVEEKKNINLQRDDSKLSNKILNSIRSMNEYDILFYNRVKELFYIQINK